MFKYHIMGAIFLLGFVYLTFPGPSSINDIQPLPSSVKSQEPGDTFQNSNIAAYFSDYWRDFVTNYYQDQMSYLNIFGITIPAIRLNHPPEESFQYIRDQQRTTYLEQYLYPFRDALFVNGYEPISKEGKQFDGISIPIEIEGKIYLSKTTIRYYPSPIWIRVLVYFLVWVLAWRLVILFKKTWRER